MPWTARNIGKFPISVLWNSFERLTAVIGGCSNLVTEVNLGFQWIPLDIGVLIQDINVGNFL